MKHFGSLKKIREASVEDFKPLSIGEKLAEQILAALREDEETEAVPETAVGEAGE
ncbi:excinuclease ABC subunit C [compost metagenome]